MIRIEIWLVPHGDESKKILHSTAEIVNDVKTTVDTEGKYGSYDAKFFQSYKFNPKKIWKTSRVEKIHRTYQGVWHILYYALKKIMENRK